MPKTDALPLGYTPYGLVWTIERRALAPAGPQRGVQERGDIASKQQGSLPLAFRTDYNKLATLIERKGKLSALFACNAIYRKQSWRTLLSPPRGTRYAVRMNSLAPRPPKVASSPSAFGVIVMNRKVPFVNVK